MLALLNCQFRLIVRREKDSHAHYFTTIHRPTICHTNVSAALLLLNYYQILYLFVFYFILYFFSTLSLFFVLILKIFRKMSLDIYLSWNNYDIVRIKFKDFKWFTKYVHKRRKIHIRCFCGQNILRLMWCFFVEKNSFVTIVAFLYFSCFLFSFVKYSFILVNYINLFLNRTISKKWKAKWTQASTKKLKWFKNLAYYLFICKRSKLLSQVLFVCFRNFD